MHTFTTFYEAARPASGRNPLPQARSAADVGVYLFARRCRCLATSRVFLQVLRFQKPAMRKLVKRDDTIIATRTFLQTWQNSARCIVCKELCKIAQSITISAARRQPKEHMHHKECVDSQGCNQCWRWSVLSRPSGQRHRSLSSILPRSRTQSHDHELGDKTQSMPSKSKTTDASSCTNAFMLLPQEIFDDIARHLTLENLEALIASGDPIWKRSESVRREKYFEHMTVTMSQGGLEKLEEDLPLSTCNRLVRTIKIMDAQHYSPVECLVWLGSALQRVFSCCPRLEILIYFQEPRKSEGLCPHSGLFATSVELYLTSRNDGSRLLTPSIHAYNISPDILRCITDYPQFSSRLQLLHVHYESRRRHALELSIQTQATVGIDLKDLFVTC